MMATTSLKLPDALKERISKIAEATGKTPHAFMVEAIAEQTERIEEDRAFIERAIASKKHFEETGIGYSAEDVYAYIREKLAGNNPPKLNPKTYK
ncbi:MAG: CopG family ribbon-helix-helix protein [Methylophilaceae bacterium]